MYAFAVFETRGEYRCIARYQIQATISIFSRISIYFYESCLLTRWVSNDQTLDVELKLLCTYLSHQGIHVRAGLGWAIKLVPNAIDIKKTGKNSHHSTKLRISKELLQYSAHLGYPLPAVSLTTFSSQILLDPCSNIDIQICHCYVDLVL